MHCRRQCEVMLQELMWHVMLCNRMWISNNLYRNNDYELMFMPHYVTETSESDSIINTVITTGRI